MYEGDGMAPQDYLTQAIWCNDSFREFFIDDNAGS